MKFLKTGLAAAAAMLIFGAAPAAAQNYYVGAHGGLNVTHDGNTGTGDEITYEFFGYGVGVEVGVRIGSNLRLEGEFTYRSSEVDTVDFAIVSGDLTSTSLMANAFYDFHSESGFTPYVGGGLGISFVDFETTAGAGDDTVVAAQLAAGVMFDLSPGLVMSVDYRVFFTEDLSIAPGFVNVEYTNSSVFVGIKKFF